MDTKHDHDRLKLSTKIGYGAGDIFGGGAFTIIGLFYLYFLTDVVRIRPSLAGIVFLVSKIWDAVSDPLMGIISDRTRSRFGRRRVYFLAGIGLIAVSFFAMWFPVDFDAELARFVYIVVAYLFFSTIITMVMVPFTALASELTGDYHERTSLAMFRMVFSGVAGILCAALPLEIVNLFEDQRTGYIVMGLGFGLVFALPFIGTFAFTFERPEFQAKRSAESVSVLFRTSFVLPFKNRSFRDVLIMFVFSFTAIDALMAIVVYFMTYYMGMADRITPVLATIFIVQVLFLPVFYFVSGRVGKRGAYSASVLLWLATLVYSFVVGPDSGPAILYSFAALLGVATAGVSVSIFAMFPDIPDVDELVSHERREGTYSGLFTFTRKAASALAIFLISNLIELAGYRPPVKRITEGVTEAVQQQQSEGFILSLRIIFVLVPLVFLAVCLVACFVYPLTPAMHDKLRVLLERRRSGERDPDLLAEEREMKRILVGGKV